MLRFLSGEEFSAEPEVIENGKAFMKATKNARQQDFKEVSKSSFWELLKHRWSFIANTDVLTMAPSTLHPSEQFTFDVFVYLAPAPRFTDGLRQAIADRVRAAAAEIAPDGTSVTVPNDNTMQQAMALNAAAETVAEEQVETEEDVDEVEVKLFGIWVKIRVKRSSLRAALGLPQHGICFPVGYSTAFHQQL
ncbi:hypothetical protein PI124_g19268 [Phytophthora idaei]|nr:hypothetical protein PI126_g18675 [Phytophthora idaei]KAG3235708.1 hypothetical protein PI124_g19268 [Phytophthora idaei]